ncbi:multidrug MFS transporter [Clostridium perfringens]|uniref:glycosyltransferase n=1 Tax=Clostridium perfringens TaxID=1502 RepID=UPI001CAB05A5|nr:glycosyltransferase [Clostridium perfringens]MDK0703827.1 glycosyltransferase [Clostridium perfringens]MDM0617949.1 glycosyltransferase [Clostridium perfringens]MDZ4973895.1 multidrug MFS transporter [Clostridium perfringens]HBI6897059.1 multidrug MFS transporter [Clostridium perfringens]HBI6917950.1 multidrug MFS transporter [Clostridium perfringens]
MIFVTVGTHEQPFNRLIKYMDKLKAEKIIQEEVIIQTGFSTYEPKYCKWSNLYSYKEMKNFVQDARIIITHGGPSSFIMPLQIGKMPIVVPRNCRYNEHVNNHQLDFAKAVEKRNNSIIVVEEINDLCKVIKEYDIISSKQIGYKSNNKNFNIMFEKIVEEVFDGN